jgi:hypothetical protein
VIAWRLALDRTINLHGQDFAYHDDRQRLEVIGEYAIFALQLIDRLADSQIGLDASQRRDLLIQVARRLAGEVQDNSRAVLGAGDYVTPFIQHLNARGGEYAEFGYGADGPSYLSPPPAMNQR